MGLGKTIQTIGAPAGGGEERREGAVPRPRTPLHHHQLAEGGGGLDQHELCGLPRRLTEQAHDCRVRDVLQG